MRGIGGGGDFGVSMQRPWYFPPSRLALRFSVLSLCGGIWLLGACNSKDRSGAGSSGGEVATGEAGEEANSSSQAEEDPDSSSKDPSEDSGESTSDSGDASSTEDPGADDSGTDDSSSKGDDIEHNWDFLSEPRANAVRSEKRRFADKSYHVFRDGLDREIHFRGWNTSGSVKLVETGFKPFKNAQDAKNSFSRMRGQGGSNIARFTLAWEGVHLGPDEIDEEYLDALIAQMREAISRKIYIFLDYHSDLYSRHTFTQQSKNTGNGAPAWVVNGGDHGKDDCGLPCDVTWSAHKLSDKAVRSAMRAFWKDAPIRTDKGERKVQTEFLWQIVQTAKYIRSKLSAAEFDFVLGIEPLNEPFDGGIEKLGLSDYKAFDNEILWPFYHRMRKAMDEGGWEKKWVFAEPMVFWSSQAGALAPATGGGHLDAPPGPGFVFSPHFYDQGRQGVNNLSVARNGAYIGDIDKIRNEAEFLDLPVLVTEFGMWIEGEGHTDTQRILNNVYQALEISDKSRRKDRFTDYFTPLIGATQWHWDIYFDNHNELHNGNPNKVLTKDDAWNNERYSVLKDYGKGYNIGQNLIERVYPRRIQGQLLQFAYHARVKDVKNKALDWHGIRLSNAKDAPVYFQDKKFFFASWMGGKSVAPSEFFLPRHLDPAALSVVSRGQVIVPGELNQSGKLSNARNEIALMPELVDGDAHGYRLFGWDDRGADEKARQPNFLLVVQDPNLDESELLALQFGIGKMLDEGRSPVYLTGRMTKGGYPRR